jgi:peptidoglycan/xylan/chitin deacetylase (PgdA/CDA1 family)
MGLRSAILRSAKAAGGFAIASYLARKGVRILCYHGFSLDDEHRFRPKLFITAKTFEQRLRWLQGQGYEPVSLQTAIARIKADELTGRELVITIDDGFYSVKAVGWPLLQEYGLPATLYVTTYYTQHANPIFRLAIQYMVWKTPRDVLNLTHFDVPLLQGDRVIPLKAAVSERSLWELIETAESSLDERERVELAAHVGKQLEVDYEELDESRRLSLLSESEVAGLSASGLDVQLHTHRHRLPSDAAGIRREIADNRRVLQRLTGRPLAHFCYPSGIWDPAYWPALQAEGIETATTCEPGLNYGATPLLSLRRLLDSEDLAMVDLEAELSGFKDAVRSLRGRLGRQGSQVSRSAY